MSKRGNYRTALGYAGSLLAIAGAELALRQITVPIVNILVLWIMVSVLIGIVIGHCALNDR